MAQIGVISGQLLQQDQALSFEEFCHALDTENAVIIEMIEFSLLEPQGNSPETWSFDSICVTRAKRALHFQQDLEVNMAGIALALDLLDQIDALHNQLNILQKHVG